MLRLLLSLFGLLLVLVSQHVVTGFKPTPLRSIGRTPPSSSPKPLKASYTNMLSSISLPLADGLDAETLNALGDVQELNEALDSAVDGSGVVVNGLQELVASPLILIVPIGAGLLVAIGLGFFISAWGSGRDVQVDGDGTK